MPSLLDIINDSKSKSKRKQLVNKTKLSKSTEKQVKFKDVSDFEKNKTSVEIFLREQKLEKLEMVSIDYSVMTKETLNRIAACEVKNINKSQDLTNTTEDPRLGTIDRYKLCATCEKTNEECPGHLGIINLPDDIIHPFFRLIAMRVLQCVCIKCNQLLLPEKHIRESGLLQIQGYTRLIKISEMSKDGKAKCKNGCASNPIFKPLKSGDNETIDMRCVKKIGKEEVPYQLKVSEIKRIFNNMSDNDVSLLGFINNHPKNFIVDFIPVIPISARPYVFRDNQKQEDYLTTGYEDVISKVIEYYQDEDTKKNSTEEERREECLKRIIFIYDHSIQNCDQAHRRSPSDVCKSINERISGKGSLMRDHLLAKRADSSGRTVLGPNRSISFGEIAAPNAMKSVLTVPEFVTIYNHDYIMEMSKENKIDYLCPREGSFSGRKLKYDRNKHTINIGDKVGRFSENGDIIIFNRQPTLKRQSFLGYVCNFQDKYTMGLHLSSTKGHNADFDGDEGNIHMLQTVDAQMEARMVMFSGNNIMNCDGSRPEAGLVFNSLTGCYLLSADDVVFTEEEFYQGIDSITRYTKNDYFKTNFSTLFERVKQYPEVTKFSGKTLVSVLFPKDFCYTFFTGDGEMIKIRNGILVSGRLTKAQTGASPGSIIQSLWKQYGMQTTMDFLTDSNFLFNWYSLKYGLSVSYRDVRIKKFDEYFKYKEEKIKDLNKEVVNMPRLKENATRIETIEHEVKIKQTLDKTEKAMEKEFYENYLERDNSLFIAINSGAKGNERQVRASTAFLGQNYVNNMRPEKLTSGGKRWLPTFHVDDNSIYSRGYSMSSYLEGLNPDEFFAQAQSSRINMTETQLNTAVTGTLQRRMVKAQENLIITYDGTVRNHNNMILQFNYGAGFDSGNMVLSYNNLGMKSLSFINLKETIEKENTSHGFQDFDIGTYMVKLFNRINSKYGDEKLVEENEDKININNLDDFRDVLKLQEEDYFDMSVDFE